MLNRIQLIVYIGVKLEKEQNQEHIFDNKMKTKNIAPVTRARPILILQDQYQGCTGLALLLTLLIPIQEYVNFQSCWIWGTQKPKVIIVFRTLHSTVITDWCVI